MPDCPYEKIVEAYHEALPDFPKVRVIGTKRKDLIKAAWRFVLTGKRLDGTARASNPEGALAWFARYFARVAGVTWIVSGNYPAARSITYLLSEAGLEKVLENEAAA